MTFGINPLGLLSSFLDALIPDISVPWRVGVGHPKVLLWFYLTSEGCQSQKSRRLTSVLVSVYDGWLLVLVSLADPRLVSRRVQGEPPTLRFLSL